MADIIVMLIWIGSHQGGPATIQGFATLEACQRAIPTILSPVWQGVWVKTGATGVTCVRLAAE